MKKSNPKVNSKVKVNVKEFPLLYQRGKNGALITWRIWTEDAVIVTQWGQENGKTQMARKIATPKNIGRANATDAITQAQAEAAAMWKHKLDRKYAQTPAEASEPSFLPMLAHDFRKHHNPLTYPVFVQRKYDGFRCIAWKEDGEVTMFSRSGDAFDLPHISEELCRFMPESYVFDGELYCHGVPFQKVASWIKKAHPESKQIRYHIYDIPEAAGDQKIEMKHRVALMDIIQTGIRDEGIKTFEVVETILAHNLDRVLELEQQFVSEGYEGAIVRTTNGLYQYGHRSYSLLKVKSFEDAEFEIIGGNPGRGKFADLCVFRCKTEEGKEFNVTPVGTEAERREYLRNLKSYIGAPMKVKFQGKSVDGIPRFPVGLGVRPDWDKSKGA